MPAREFRATIQYDPGQRRWIATVGELAEGEGLTVEGALAALRLDLVRAVLEGQERGLPLPEDPRRGVPVEVWVPAEAGHASEAVRPG